MDSNNNRYNDRNTFLDELRDIGQELIIALYVLWDDEIVQPYRRWRLRGDIAELFQRRDITHRFATGRAWMVTLAIIFCFGKFFPEQVANLPGVSWVFDFIVGFIDLLFEFAHRGLRWFFGEGKFSSFEWLEESFKALL